MMDEDEVDALVALALGEEEERELEEDIESPSVLLATLAPVEARQPEAQPQGKYSCSQKVDAAASAASVKKRLRLR